MEKLFDYQIDIVKKAQTVLQNLHIVYIVMGMRTGKTRVALTIAKDYNRVLFVTKKRVINFVKKENEILQGRDITVINYEQLDKYTKEKFDLIVVDEAHSIGAFPKPSLRAKRLKEICNYKTDVILMSGTPTPESLSQYYHQFYISPHSPFSKFYNFYGFAREWVNIFQKRLSSVLTVNVYTDCKKEILDFLSAYTVALDNNYSGLKTVKREYIVEVEDFKINEYIREVEKTGVLKDFDYIKDNASDEFQKIWQLSGGFAYMNNKTEVISIKKAEKIKTIKGKTIIFYKFIAEFDILKNILGDNLTQTPEIFQDTDIQFIGLQYLSGREGINLSKAKNIVYYNLDYSYTSYSQSQERATSRLEGEVNIIYMFFKDNKIEQKVLSVLKGKHNFNLKNYLSFKKEV